jgi:hypothetical protein
MSVLLVSLLLSAGLAMSI